MKIASCFSIWLRRWPIGSSFSRGAAAPDNIHGDGEGRKPAGERPLSFPPILSLLTLLQACGNPASPPSTYSHSIVLGGLLLMSYTTRVTPGTSFTILVDILSSTSPGSLTQSAVIASSDSTTRPATVNPYVLPSPITPTLLTGSSTANACHTFS